MLGLAAVSLGLLASALGSGEKLSMTIHQSGFHRTLRYDTYFLQPWRPDPCDFCLEQTIPAGAYVDTDQLDDLVRLNKIAYYTNARVNVEAIASKSAPFKIYVFGNSASMHSINLPVHFRYHLAGDDSFVRVTIDPPRMLMNCTPNAHQSRSLHLPHDAAGAVTLPCKPSVVDQLCVWQPVDYELHSDPIVVSLPIGSRAVEPLVTFVTITVAWAACYYIALAVYTKAHELDKRQ